MCVGGGSTNLSSVRRLAGNVGQRQVQTQSLQSVFQPGVYSVNNTRRLRGDGSAYGGFSTANSGFRKDRSRGVRIDTEAQYNKLLGQDIQVQQRTNPLASQGRRWTPQGTTKRTDGDFKRTSGGSTFKNEVRADKQNRVAVRDETNARIKTRTARAGQKQEVNFRSQRKRKGTGLRIGGSGVNVPGGGSGVSV